MRKSILTLLSLLLLVPFLSATYTLTPLAETTVQQGENLGVIFTLTSDAGEFLNGHPCKAWTSHNNSYDIIDLKEYDTILEEPLTLVTDSQGLSYAVFPIGDAYGSNQTFQVTGNCNGTVSTPLLFEVHPFDPTDYVASVFFSFITSSGAWFGVLFIIAIIGFTLVSLSRGVKV